MAAAEQEARAAAEALDAVAPSQLTAAGGAAAVGSVPEQGRDSPEGVPAGAAAPDLQHVTFMIAPNLHCRAARHVHDQPLQ